MAKIPFNINFRPQIEAGEYKIEIGKSDPWPARIVCWDLNGNDLIIIVTNPEGKEEGLIYTPEGKHKAYAPKVDSDLFIITPEPELSEFEQEVSDIVEYCKEHGENVAFGYAKRHAKTLLELARQQLQPEIDAEIENAYKNQDEVVYENGKKDGYEEAMKDLPRWEKCNQLNTGQTTVVIGYTKDKDMLYRNGKVISLLNLEKLPGFKED